jgi:hypothetical protein
MRTKHVLPAVVVTLTVAWCATADAAVYIGGSYAYKDESTTCANADLRLDPIGVLFRGSGATARNLGGYFIGHLMVDYVKGIIQLITGWSAYSPSMSPQKHSSYGACTRQDQQNASNNGIGKDRFHVRLWQLEQQYAPGRWATVGTPHFEVSDRDCGGVFGKHRVPRRIATRIGSGYDYARKALQLRFQRSHHFAVAQKFIGNRWPVTQCKGVAHSNGELAIIYVGRDDVPQPYP